MFVSLALDLSFRFVVCFKFFFCVCVVTMVWFFVCLYHVSSPALVVVFSLILVFLSSSLSLYLYYALLLYILKCAKEIRFFYEFNYVFFASVFLSFLFLATIFSTCYFHFAYCGGPFSSFFCTTTDSFFIQSAFSSPFFMFAFLFSNSVFPRLFC